MCCVLASLLFFGPRIALLIYWLFPMGRLRIDVAFDSWIVPLLGWLFVPWVTLFYALLFPVRGFDWIILAIGVIIDIGSYFGGAYSRR